jgi:hypothetical protein
MNPRATFHLLGETLTFMSRHEISASWADWIELDSVQNANEHGFNPYGREGWHWEYNVGAPY